MINSKILSCMKIYGAELGERERERVYFDYLAYTCLKVQVYACLKTN